MEKTLPNSQENTHDGVLFHIECSYASVFQQCLDQLILEYFLKLVKFVRFVKFRSFTLKSSYDVDISHIFITFLQAILKFRF